MRIRLLIGVSVAIALTLILVMARPTLRRHRTALAGVWTGDPEFLSRAQLSDLQLFLAPGGDQGGFRGYLIMVDNRGGFVANHTLRLVPRFYSPRTCVEAVRLHFSPDRALNVAADLEFDPASPQDPSGELAPPPPALPPRMRLALSTTGGGLTLYNADDKVYAFMHRDGAASTAALAAWGEAGPSDSSALPEPGGELRDEP